jgi:hypothetical protein
VAEHAPGAGAIDRRGLVEFQRDRLQPRQQRDGEEREPLPSFNRSGRL